MKRSTARIFAGVIAAFLAFIMLFGLVSSLFEVQGLTTSQANLDKLKDNLANAAKTKKQLEGQLSKLKTDKANVNKEISALDEKMDAMDKEIDLHSAIVAQLGEMVTEKEGEIVTLQAKEDDQYAKLKTRVRTMYENGTASYLEILLESADFFEFLSRYEIINQISQYEKKMVEQIKATKQEIISQKESLLSNKAEEEEMRTSLQGKMNEYDSELTQRERMMNKIEVAEGESKEKYEQIAAEEDRMNGEIKKMIAELAAQNKGDYVGGTFLWPAPGYTRVTSNFGMRYHPVLHVNKLHTGTDVGASKGAKVVAMNDGTVATATYNSALGNYVVIDHGGGVATLYAHMSKLSVSKGAKIARGAQVGLVGSTGYSTGPHLHFEVIKGGKNVDPMSYFK